MIGKIFVTSSGYDPAKGKHIKDPYLGPAPSLGICRPDIRERLRQGDHVFLVSGKVSNHPQVVLGGFEVAKKISAIEAYRQFPEQRLKQLPDGQVTGNIIVNEHGRQHPLDHHEQFTRRAQNYIVGANPVALLTPEEVEVGRLHTLEILREVFQKKGNSVREIIGRCRNLTDSQILLLRDLLFDVKRTARQNKPQNNLRHTPQKDRAAS